MYMYIQTVFIHELGHFVSNILNRDLYSGPKIESLIIFPCKEDPYQYCGELKLEGVDDFTLSKEVLIKTLISLSYGCMFQCYYDKKNDLNDCFNRNGQQDILDWKAALKKIGYADNIIKKACKLMDEHYQKLYDNRMLPAIMKIQAMQYLKKDKNGSYYADIGNLECYLNKCITLLKEEYKAHYKDYQRLLEIY